MTNLFIFALNLLQVPMNNDSCSKIVFIFAFFIIVGGIIYSGLQIKEWKKAKDADSANF